MYVCVCDSQRLLEAIIWRVIPIDFQCRQTTKAEKIANTAAAAAATTMTATTTTTAATTAKYYNVSDK